MTKQIDDSIPAVLRRRCRSLRDEGYNENFCRAFMRAAEVIESIQPNVADGPVRCRCGWAGNRSELVSSEPVGDAKCCPECHAGFRRIATDPLPVEPSERRCVGCGATSGFTSPLNLCRTCEDAMQRGQI